MKWKEDMPEGFECPITLYVVLVGNISDGFSAYGPFDSFDSASLYADKFNEMSWIMEMVNTLKEGEENEVER
jgi:hypothetical protein|tara:strand:- start:404 stop:619 length:216 start_codon:yes stop_codon:yes gene_type:complete